MTTEPSETPPSPVEVETSPVYPESSAPVVEPVIAASDPVEKPKMGRLRRVWRIALLALVAVGLVFLAGMLTDHYVRYVPMKASLAFSLAQTQADLDQANLHIELLQALVEIKTAHLELASGNVAGAKSALLNTAARLETLKPAVESVDATLAANMRTRLEMILSGMDGDPQTAQADLGLLAQNLLSVETLLFAK